MDALSVLAPKNVAFLTKGMTDMYYINYFYQYEIQDQY